jgi:MtrB/PioB family decaheme-associated outer membrane protein
MNDTTHALWKVILGGIAAAMCVVAAPSWVGAQGEIEALADVPLHYTQNPSVMEFGLLYNTDDSFRFGDYTGIDEEQLYFVGNIDLQGRKAFDSGSTTYWRLTALNMALDSRLLHFEFGQQGKFGLFFDYDQMPKLQSDSGSKFMGGDGHTAMTLPSVWVPATTPAGMTELTGNLRDLEVEHERRTTSGGFSFLLSENWKVRAKLDHQTKKGTKTMAALIAASGGNPRATLFPSPINFATNQFDLGIEYAGQNGQFQLNYYLSSFDNRDDDGVTFENPYSSPGGWNPVAAYPTGMGRKSLAPDNRFDQITLAAGYSLPAKTRVTLNAAFGKMTQDETFLPYTVNPGLTVTTPLPRQDLDGEINTTVIDLRISSRPVKDLTLNASYRYDDRDNDSSHDTYIYIPSDATDQGAIDGSRARINHPISYKQTEFGLGGRYRIAKRTDLTLDYTHETVERTYAEVDKTRENGIRAKLRTRPWNTLSVGLTAESSSRDASTYHHNEPYLTGHSPEYIALQSGVGLWENHPLLRRFYLTDRDKQEFGAFASWMPLDTLTVNLNLNNVQEDFDDTEVGLTDRSNSTYSLDLSWVPTEEITSYLFYSFEHLKYQQNGWSFQGFAKAAQYVNPGRRWEATTKDRINTVGLGLKWELIEGKLDLEFDYLYAYSVATEDINVGPALGTSPPFPDNTTRLRNFHVGLDYKLRENVTVRVGYLFEKYKISDWATRGVEPDTLSQVITLGEDAPDYDDQLFFWSVLYDF